MFRISADTLSNRLVIIIKGKVKESDLEPAFAELERNVALLSPYFAVITDFSFFESLELVTSPFMHKVSSFLIEHKVGKIIRVVGPSREGLIKFNQATANIDKYEVQYVSSMDDAIKALNRFKY